MKSKRKFGRSSALDSRLGMSINCTRTLSLSQRHFSIKVVVCNLSGIAPSAGFHLMQRNDKYEEISSSMR